jgi:hypothetical protein
VRQHDALGRAARAAAPEQHGATLPRRRGIDRPRSRTAAQAPDARGVRAVLREYERAQLEESRGVDARARGNGQERVLGHGGLAGQDEGDASQRRVGARGELQHDLLARILAAQHAGELQRRLQELAVGQARTARIDQRHAPLMRPGAAHEAVGERARLRGAPHARERELRRERVAHLPGLAPRRERLAHDHVDRVGQALGPLPEEAPAAEAEDRAPDAVEHDRHDRHLRVARDRLQAALEAQQVAGARDRALGEDAHELARARPLGGAPQRLLLLGRGVLGGDRNGVEELRHPAHHRRAEEGTVHQEEDAPRDRRADEESVAVREVVGDEQRAARGQAFQSVQADAVDRMQQREQQRARERHAEGPGQRQQQGGERELPDHATGGRSPLRRRGTPRTSAPCPPPAPRPPRDPARPPAGARPR